MFSKRSFGHTRFRENLFSLSFMNFFKLSSKLCQFVNPNFLGTIFFLINGENALTVSWESFVFIHFASTVRLNRSWWTSKIITSLLSFASFSTKAGSILHNSFLNLLNKKLPSPDFLCGLSKLCVKVFICKTCLNFDISRLPAWP